MIQDFLGIIPAQYTGKEIEVFASLEIDNQDEAVLQYEIVKERLLNVNNWHHVAGFVSAKFQIVDLSGKEVYRHCQLGDYLKIDIPGPGSKEGEGYDWVCIEELKEVNTTEIRSLGFTVRPSHNPQKNSTEIAHFYSSGTTSSFIVVLEYSKVTAWVVDRNLKPNDNTDSLIDKIRDSTIGVGAIGIFSRVQWQNLVDGLVK